MIGNSEGKLKGAGMQRGTTMAVPAGALGPDKSNIPVLVTKLKKKSRKGRWDNRYFRANNHYLTYYKSAKLAKICCCHDICKATHIEVNGRFGYFDVEFGDETVALKAKDLDEAETWVENLTARRKLFQGTLSSTIGNDNDDGRVQRANTGITGGIILEGYLDKKSPSRFRGFQARYFILGDGLVRYYKTKPEDSEIDSEMQGALHVAGLISVLPVMTDKEKLSFILKMPGRTFELKAKSTPDCILWITALDQAHNKMKEDNQALEEQVQEKQEQDAVAQLPQLVQMFDATDSGERAENIMMHVVSTFEHHHSETIDGMVQGLTDCLEELNDMVETCASIDPPRSDIIQEHISYYHGSILFKVNEVKFMPKENIQAHEALRMMDFVNAYSDLLERAAKAGADVATFNAEEDDKVKEILDFLTICYVSRAAPELKKMCHNISSFVINSPQQAIRDHGGSYTTTAPIDLNNMINQYVEISGRGGLDSLQARVFGMCLDGMCAYHHDVELHCTDLKSGEDLIFLCAIANDAESFLTSMETLEDRFIDLIEDNEMEDELEATTMQCHMLGQLALLQMETVIFNDLGPFFRKLFDAEWSSGNSEAMETILATLEDYFEEFSTRCHHRSMVKLIGYCYNRFLVEYVSQMIEKYTKRSRNGARGPTKLCLNPTTAQIIAGDLFHAKDIFTTAAETIEHSNGRSFRLQFQFSNWFEDIVHRTPIINLHEGVFRPMCAAHKKQPHALPYAFCLMSHLTLCRDFDLEDKHWREMKEMGLSEDEMKHMKKPPNRIEILKDGLICLENVYDMNIRVVRASLEKEAKRVEAIESVIRTGNYHKTLPILNQLLVNQSTNHDEVKSILDHHKELEKEGKITEEQLNARSVQEGTLLKVRTMKGGSLLTRVCENVLEQLNVDEEAIRPSKKRSMGIQGFAQAAAGWGFGKSKKKKNPSNNSAPEIEHVEREAYKMWQNGDIDKDQYEHIVAQHQRLQMAESEFDEERKRNKDNEKKKKMNGTKKLKKMKSDVKDDGQHHVPESSPLENAKKLLAMGMITQEEFDELQGTIMAAHAAFEGEMEGDEDVEEEEQGEKDETDEMSSSESGSGSESSETDEEGDEVDGLNINAPNPPQTLDGLGGDQDTSNSLPVRHRALSQAAKYDLEALRGYMQKKAKTMSQWRRRWFSVKRVYDPQAQQWCMSICWHKDHNSPAITAIPIEMLSDVQKTEQKLMFKIMVTPPEDLGVKKRVILLKAETEEQQNAWVDALTNMITEVKNRMKTEFMRESGGIRKTRLQSLGSNISLVELDDGGDDADAQSHQTEHKVGATPSPRKRNRGKARSKRTSVFEMKTGGTTTHASPAVTARPAVHAMESLQEGLLNERLKSDGLNLRKSFDGDDDEEEEMVSVPASQGCGCVIA